jgi:penicillin amidase
MKRIASYTLVVVALVAAGLYLYLPHFDSYQVDGELAIGGLSAPATVRRDKLGVPYIHAASLDDGLVAQGFVTAQDRLFQMELFRSLGQGRLAELIGEKGLKSDRLVRILDLPGLSLQQAARASGRERNFMQRYADGINAFIEGYPDQYPRILGMMGRNPEPWTVEDIIMVQNFRVWSSSINWRQELMTLRLIDELGPLKAAELAPLSVNPDNELFEQVAAAGELALDYGDRLANPFEAEHAMGSNAWVSDGEHSENGLPIVVNDPHIDVRNLPGFWYPIGLVTPELRIVGGSTPGVPGMGVARNGHIAWGATNGYGDVVDLFIEQVDPANADNYLEGENSYAFEISEEVIRIKDDEAENGFREESITVRTTNRGPVISDHGMTLADGRVITLRWAIPEYMGSDTGILDLMISRSVEDARQAIGKAATPLNYLVADKAGNIARIASGYVPIRRFGEGLVPLAVNAQDNWLGRIPAEEMPQVHNPEAGWAGSANHDIVPANYHYPFSTHFSPSWRYRRLQEYHAEVLANGGKMNADKQWTIILDVKNDLGQRQMTQIIDALDGDTTFDGLVTALREWNYFDTTDSAGALVFHQLLRHFAVATFEDDLSEQLLSDYLKDTYYSQERLIAFTANNQQPWFDNRNTPQVETRDDLWREAARRTLAEMTPRFGADASQWQWGNYHTITFFHPLVPGETGAKWFGGGVHPFAGSAESLNRGLAFFDDPENTRIIASLRMVIDLADDDKIEAHFPGGNSERLFSPWMKSQLPAWLSGEKLYWWFSDAAIEANAEHQLELMPVQMGH